MPFYGHKAADNASSAALFSTLSFLLHRQDIPHGPGCFFLCAGGDVGVGVQSEAGGEVTQHGRKSSKCNTGGKDLRRRKPIEAFSGTAIDEMLNALNISI